MSRCSICGGAVEAPRLADPVTGDQWHPACLARSFPEDVLAVLLATVALALSPLIIVWAA
jgi:hypothetical protein